MKKKRKLLWLILPVVLIGAAVGALFYFRAHPIQMQSASTLDLTKVTTTRVITGTINTTISATGTVRTSQNATVSWSSSGKVAKVLVKKGDEVEANQVLAQLDPSSSASLVTAQANLATAEQILADLQNVTVSQANAQVALITAQAAVTTAQNAIYALNANVSQAQIDAANVTYLSDLQSVSRAQEAFDKVAGFDDTDIRKASALSTLSTAKEKERTDLNTLNYLKNYKPDAATLAQDQAKLELAKAQLVTAQAAVDALKNGPDASKVAAAQANIKQIQATIDAQYLRAPFAGTITSLTVKAGDLVNSGTSALRIDDMSVLYVELSVSEVDIDNVKLAQAAEITYDAIAGKTYAAEVTDIGAIGTVAGGVANYAVTIKLTDNDASVRPGMMATANLIVEQAENVLLVPNHAITTLGKNKVIYILANNQVNLVTVTAGLASDTQTEITSADLQEGALVVTNPTSVTSSATTNTSTGINSIFANLFRSLGVTTTGRASGVGGGRPSGGFDAGGQPPSGRFPSGNPPTGGFPSDGQPGSSSGTGN